MPSIPSPFRSSVRTATFVLLAACVTPGFRLRAASISAPASFAELARTSDLVVIAEAGPSWTVERSPLIFTRTSFTVAAGLGSVDAPRRLDVECPGGAIGARAWHVDGSPRFDEGRTYLLCLARKDATDGSVVWIPRTLAWGVFEERTGASGTSLLVPLDARMPSIPTEVGATASEPLAPYETDALVEHLDAVLRDRATWSRELVLADPSDVPATGTIEAPPAGCSFFVRSGRNFRWNAFDRGDSATIFADSRGDLSLAGGGFREIAEAVDTWNDIDATGLNLIFGGTTTVTLDCASGQESQSDAIVLNDPCSDIDDLVNGGGTLAFGGPLTSGTHAFDGASWETVVGWIVVVNNGVGIIGSRGWTLMMAHELGHGLGFGHVNDPAALMFASCCNSPNSTDIRCAQYTYPPIDANDDRPDVDAGPNRTVRVARDALRLTGSVSDDRAVLGSGLEVTWRTLAGPGTVVFESPNVPETMAHFSRSGEYLLALTADDGRRIRTDVVSVDISVGSGTVATAEFRQRANGYAGTVDTFLQESAPTANNARAGELSVDGDDPGDSGLENVALLRFDDVFGTGPRQVPPGAPIRGARLALTTTNEGAGATLHRLLVPWDDTIAWSDLDSGFRLGRDAATAADATTGGTGSAIEVDVTASLAEWSEDPCTNLGWAFVPTGTDGWDFESSESTPPPALSIDYLAVEERTIIELGDAWRYFKGTRNPPAAWRDPEFTPDEAWLEGPTGIGYGDGDDRTVLADMEDAYLTVYCRKTFEVDDPGLFGRLRLAIDYDDGFAAYLNGVEVARSATLGAAGSPLTRLSQAASREAGEIEEYSLDTRALRVGTNVLAIEVHNQDIGSSDLSFRPSVVASPVIIDEGHEWAYLRGRSAPPTDWAAADFDDGGWERGPAGIGYADGDDLTVLEDMEDAYLTVFCRTTFALPDPDAAAVVASVIYDDGISLWLNGTEVGRAGLPDGSIDHQTRATSSAETEIATFALPRALLRAGANVLAASVHNQSVSNSDLSFVPVVFAIPGAATDPRCGDDPEPEPPARFLRGDANEDGSRDLADAIRILGFLFLGDGQIACADSADADDDGEVTLTDAVRILNHLFLGAAAPPEPSAACGEDPTEDDSPECSTAPCAE